MFVFYPAHESYRNLLASRSDSSRHRMSSTFTVHTISENALLRRACPSLPGPLTFRMMLRLVSSMNSTLTCVTPPRDPVSSCQHFLLNVLRCTTDQFVPIPWSLLPASLAVSERHPYCQDREMQRSIGRCCPYVLVSIVGRSYYSVVVALSAVTVGRKSQKFCLGGRRLGIN